MNPAAVLLDNRRWLWVVIYARLGDAVATEDVLQEVSVAAVRSQASFDETGHAKSWLLSCGGSPNDQRRGIVSGIASETLLNRA